MSKTTNKFSPEVRERAVRLVLETEGQHASRWRAVMSIAARGKSALCEPSDIVRRMAEASMDAVIGKCLPTSP
jgi:transposase